MNDYIVFHSQRSNYSVEFIDLLRKSGLFNRFVIYDLENRRDKFREYQVKFVPTLMVPDMNRPMEGNDAFFWLTNTINRLRQKQNESINHGGNSNQLPPMRENFANPGRGMSGGQGHPGSNMGAVQAGVEAGPISAMDSSSTFSGCSLEAVNSEKPFATENTISGPCQFAFDDLKEQRFLDGTASISSDHMVTGSGGGTEDPFGTNIHKTNKSDELNKQLERYNSLRMTDPSIPKPVMKQHGIPGTPGPGRGGSGGMGMNPFEANPQPGSGGMGIGGGGNMTNFSSVYNPNIENNQGGVGRQYRVV